MPYTHWAAGYVEAAVAAGLVTAYSDGTFRPDNPITLAEGATIALGLLGYTAEDYSGAYPTPSWPCTGARGWTRGCPPSGRRTPSPGRTPCTSSII